MGPPGCQGPTVATAGRLLPWCVALLLTGCGPAPPSADPDAFVPERVQLPVDPTTEVTVRPARGARDALKPSEPVLGVTVGNASRAYPVNLLMEEHLRYKVLNDTLGERPIAVTWCDLCHTGAVYDRVVDGRTLTLGVSGQLWRQNMVFYDRETRSLWSQLPGESKLGPLKGKRLRPLSAVLTDWQTWCRHHPDSTVAGMSHHGNWVTVDMRRKQPERFVLAVADGTAAKAWSLDTLAQAGVVNDEWAGRPVLAVLDGGTFTARLFGRDPAGRVLTFASADGRLTDRETGSTWEPVMGRAVDGPLAGQSLTPLPAVVAFRDAWFRFYPRSD